MKRRGYSEGMKLLVLAAGLGSRFGGVKQLASIGPAGETLLEYNLFNALEAGFDSVVFLIRQEIEEDFRDLVLPRLPRSLAVELAFQSAEAFIPEKFMEGIAAVGRTKPWGTGHALLCAQDFLKEGPFAVMNADDFYGKDGFSAIHGFLFGQGVTAERDDQSISGALESRAGGPPAKFCLAGYRLGGVVSTKGSVSRAICSIGVDGSLEKIVEHTGIELRLGEIRSFSPDGSSEVLEPNLPVSMNLWGLVPAVFPWAERLFEEFLADQGHWAKAEFYLPVIIGNMIDAGAAKVWTLPVDEEYFGLTNPDDIAGARQAITARTKRGDYPSPLWGVPPTGKEESR